MLTEALPEFRNIDSLVVRDFYHRYTVDEHSLRTIEHLQELADSSLDAQFEQLDSMGDAAEIEARLAALKAHA